MGIQGLLPLLKSIMVPIHVRDLEGCCVAVDTYSWLHKGALSCSKELCKGQPTTRHIDYCMHRVNLLRHHGIKPILVFDGGLLPMKSEQEIKRSRVRKENLERAFKHESNGNSAAAYECYQKAVDISPFVAYMLIQVLKKENVDYVVAPYEADAQMTFLALSRRVDAVITEDSDLIAFGCPRIIFKMDKFGQGVQYQYSMLQQNQELDFTGFTQQMVLEMCILSGCGYLQSLPGMGLKRAHALIQKFRSYEKVIKHLRYNTSSVPPLYEESFKKALLTFQYQRVYDATAEHIVHLTEIPDDLGDKLDFLGPLIPQDIVKGIAKGDLDPITKLPFKDVNVCDGTMLHTTYHAKIFKFETARSKVDLPAQKNTLTNYFCSTSVEAKKAFTAPRAIPKNLDSAKKSPISIDLVPEVSPASSNALHGSLLNGGALSISTLANFVGDGSLSDSSLSSKSLIGYSRSSERVARLQLSAQAVCKPCLTLQKCQDELKFDGAGSKMKSMSRKVVVSSYFKQKLSNENNQQGSNEEFVSVRTVDDHVDCENTVFEINSTGNDDMHGYTKRRKLISTERTQDDTSEGKHKQATESLSIASGCANDLASKNIEKSTAGENFGSSIAHINYYSEVSEKSMERFLSAMTSFKYRSGAGSRASGLRAPLKDVRNTHWTGSTNISLDVTKFSYLPSKNQKRASAARRP